MQLQVTSHENNKAVSTVDVADAVFNCEYKEGLVHQVLTAYMAKARSGSKAQKNRSAVSGGGAKPWRQKGTGRARAGTSRSPLWVGGGVTFAAQPRDYSQKVNKKVYRVAMASILSELQRQERLIIVDALTLPEAKTKALAGKLKVFDTNNVLLVTAEQDDNLSLAARNLPHTGVLTAQSINPLDLVAFEKIIMTHDALKKIEEKLS